MGWIFAMRIGCWSPAIVLDVPVVRNDEMRLQSFAYVFEVLAVLPLAHAERGEESRIISFRKASAEEWEMSHKWLENDFTD